MRMELVGARQCLALETMKHLRLLRELLRCHSRALQQAPKVPQQIVDGRTQQARPKLGRRLGLLRRNALSEATTNARMRGDRCPRRWRAT